MNRWPVWQGTFLPFGQEWNPQITTNHYKFTGKERDSEDGLDYFGARYYSSTMGRWMSPDWADKPEPVPYADLSDPQSLNLYGYVRNNPMSRIDLDGHCWNGLQWACNFGQRVDNTFHGLGFHTDRQVEDILHRDNLFLRQRGVSTEGLAGAAVIKTYQTYMKRNAAIGRTYSGRTSGTGTPEQNVALRDRNHHMNEEGYGPAELDESSSSYNAIRGREQQLIEANGGAQSEGGTSGNAINGVSRSNPNRPAFEAAAEGEFGAASGPEFGDAFTEGDYLNSAAEAGGVCGMSGNSPCQ